MNSHKAFKDIFFIFLLFQMVFPVAVVAKSNGDEKVKQNLTKIDSLDARLENHLQLTTNF